MVVQVASLPSRSPASLRAFMAAQRVGVRRFPDSVEPGLAGQQFPFPLYWRFLLRRVPLEGVCAHYQSYDASGDENDWNLNIVPGPGYEWMLDTDTLHALSMASGAPWGPLKINKIKSYDGARAIEAEVSPDNFVHGKFEDAGLPIDSGSVWPNKGGNKGLGPTGQRVGVYGAFVGDYGHDGRPEVHPFDAFWRRFHEPRSNEMSWDLSVIQDDSNRFNGDWSKAPIDVEFRVPFCVDFPVTARTSTKTSVVFRLAKSDLCQVIAKNTRAGQGPAVLTESFTGRTVLFRPFAENRVDLRFEDLSGIAGPAFTKSLADLRFTRTRRLGRFTTGAWLSGSLVIRTVVGQDGIAYWNLSGPNSSTAADAADGLVVSKPDDIGGVFQSAKLPPPSPPVTARIVEAHPVVDPSARGRLTAEIVVETGEGPEQRSTIMVEPRQVPIVCPDPADPSREVELESFDLFASLSAVAATQPETGSTAAQDHDISDAIGRMAGLTRLGRTLRPIPASVELDDTVTLEFATCYAPFRDGEVQGEEDSLLATAMTAAVNEPTSFDCEIRMVTADGNTRRLTQDSASADLQAISRTESTGDGHRLVVESLGASPVTIEVGASFRDAFGLEATASAVVTNYRILKPASWLAEAAGISLGAVKQSCADAEEACVDCPDPAAVTAVGLLTALDGVLSDLAASPMASAERVAGAARLIQRVSDLVPTARLT